MHCPRSPPFGSRHIRFDDVCKNIEVQRILEEHWQEIVTDRRYVAVVSGKMEKEGGTISSWLKDNKAYVTYSSPTDNGGKYAVTHFHTLDARERYSLVELKLETGRKTKSVYTCKISAIR